MERSPNSHPLGGARHPCDCRRTGRIFRLKFGSEVPSAYIIDTEDPRFKLALARLPEGERSLARGEWLKALVGGAADIPAEVRDAVEKELGELNVLHVIDPPVRNEYFTAYFAIVTPKTDQLGAI